MWRICIRGCAVFAFLAELRVMIPLAQDLDERVPLLGTIRAHGSAKSN